MSKRIVSLLAVSALALGTGAAFAQSNPSAGSIIDSLTPRSPMSTTRGIRPLNPTGAPPQAIPFTPQAAPAPAPITAGMPATPAPMAAPRLAPRRYRPAAPTPAVANESEPSVNLSVQFATGSAQLTPAAVHTLDELGRALSSNKLATYRFRIEGHTDTTGNPEHNQQLSDERAHAVVDYLAQHFGVDRSRLEAVGMGESHLLVPTGQNVPEPRNRRVTVVNLGA